MAPTDEHPEIPLPDIVVTIGEAIIPTLWARMSVVEALRSQFASLLPDLQVVINLGWNVRGEEIDVFVPTFANAEGRLLKRSSASAEAVSVVRTAVFETVLHAATQVVTDFRRRLDRCNEGMAEYQARPMVLREFMSEVANLYGFVVETDLALLMASDHFNRSEEAQPGVIHQFSRGGDLRPGEWGVLTHHERSAADLGKRFSFAGINRVLRNRAVVIYLFDLWEYHYRKAMQVAAGLLEPPSSDLFGDLRQYRNKAAHGSAKLEKPTKVLKFVQVGESIDLVGDMDELFAMVVDELNALSQRYFGVQTHFSLGYVAKVLPIAMGTAWSDRPRRASEEETGPEEGQPDPVAQP